MLIAAIDLVTVEREDLEEVLSLLMDYVDLPEVWGDTIARFEGALGMTLAQVKFRRDAEERSLRFWIYSTEGNDWRVRSRTNDEATARWLFKNANDAHRRGGVRLVDVETSTILEEGITDANAPPAPRRCDRADRRRLSNERR